MAFHALGVELHKEGLVNWFEDQLYNLIEANYD